MMDHQDMVRLAAEAYHAAQGAGVAWDASYESELAQRGLHILSANDTRTVVMNRNFSAALPGPFRNPHGEWCACSGRAIGPIEEETPNDSQ